MLTGTDDLWKGGGGYQLTFCVEKEGVQKDIALGIVYFT